MDALDLQLLVVLEDGLPLVPEPFSDVGRTLGLTGDEVIGRIKALQEAGIIRRFRARINQRRVGITANALVAWKPGKSAGGDPGELLASSPSVTHCYERRPVPGKWEYTFYTVHHGYSRIEVLEEVRAISLRAGIRDYLVMFSTAEYKRVPNVRIRENGGISH